MILEFADNSYEILPGTLAIDMIRSEANYEIHRAPFSTVNVLSGDGLPRAEPFNISGMMYFGDNATANAWIMSMRDKIFTARRLYVEGWLVELHSADLIIVPTLLPRILNVKMKVYPSNVEPFDWPDGLTLEYRFDEGTGSTLVEHVSGADATITNPSWSSDGLVMSSGSYVTLPGAATTLLESANWSQLMAMVGEGTSDDSAGIVGSLTSANLSGEMYRTGTGLKTTLVTGTTVTTLLGGDLWDGTPRIVNSFRSSGETRSLDTQPIFGIVPAGGDTSAGASGTRTFGRNNTSYMDGTLMYYVAFNRYLLNEERERAYRLIRFKLLERGVVLTW